MFDFTMMSVGKTCAQRRNKAASAGAPILATICLAMLATAASASVASAEGELDPRFGNRGSVTTTLPGIDFTDGRAVVIQGDGKIVVAINVSTFIPPQSFKNAIGVVRYNPDGSLDRTFNGSGFSVATGSGTVAVDVALQADGKIVVGGTSAETGVNTFLLVRFTTDGAVDRTFGDNGRAAVRVSTDPFGADNLNAIAVDADGSIVSVGNATFPGTGQDFVVMRHDANGRLDATFGDGGIVVVAPTPEFEELTSVAIQADGRIVAAGNPGFNAAPHFVIVRLLDSGRLDPEFDGDGLVLAAADTFFVRTQDVVIQADQRIVVGGHTLVFPKHQTFLTRHLPDGKIDTSFGEDGVAKAFAGLSASDLALQADGRVVVTGSLSTQGFPPDFLFAAGRFTADGQADPAFGTNGFVTTNFQPGVPTFENASAVAVQADGKIVVAGSVGANLTLVRYLGPAPRPRP